MSARERDLADRRAYDDLQYKRAESMHAHPTLAGPTTEPSPVEVVRCERIDAGERATLVRVTLALGETAPADAARAQLVAEDRGNTRRIGALPSPGPAGATTVTLGFGVPRTATPLGLVLAGRSYALPAPDDVARLAERRLRTVQARLDASRGAYALVESERDEALRATAGAVRERDDALRAAAVAELARAEALRAAARAEAAAHDASARADALAQRPPMAAPPVPPAAVQPSRRAARRAAVGAFALGAAALVVAILAWPARGGDADHRVAGVAAARASAADAPRPAPPAVDPLAARLGIPAAYLALYRRAAARYGLDWTRLAAVGAIESGHGQGRANGIATGANLRGASGPAQFLPGTWERFGLDGDGDGDRDPYDPADAIFAMASYLRASGAPQDWRAALRAYNHSDAYVTSVETLAASLRGEAA
jgi:membrane-bound lytic murein transglycosylase B